MLSKMSHEEIERYLIEEALKPWPTRREQLTAIYTRDLVLLVMKSQREPDWLAAVNALKEAFVRALGMMMVPLKDEARIGLVAALTRMAAEVAFEMDYGPEWRGPMAKAMTGHLQEKIRERS